MSRMHALILLAAIAAGPASAESLYDERTYRALAADRKAFRVGDVITVQVYENSSATSTTDTATQRRNNLDVSLRLLKQWDGSAGVAGDFGGGGSTQRTNRLLATLRVRVREVLPNGDLKLGGEQVLTVNEEKHTVNVAGRVRPQDVSSDNVVLSTRMAEAHIEYVGDGDLSQRQRRSWWRKLVDWVGL